MKLTVIPSSSIPMKLICISFFEFVFSGWLDLQLLAEREEWKEFIVLSTLRTFTLCTCNYLGWRAAETSQTHEYWKPVTIETLNFSDTHRIEYFLIFLELVSDSSWNGSFRKENHRPNKILQRNILLTNSKFQEFVAVSQSLAIFLRRLSGITP